MLSLKAESCINTHWNEKNTKTSTREKVSNYPTGAESNEGRHFVSVGLLSEDHILMGEPYAEID